MSQDRTVDNAKLIAGLIKECLFFSRSLTLDHGGNRIEAHLADYREPAVWSDASKCSVVLRLEQATTGKGICMGDTVGVSCGFAHFLAQWSCVITATEDFQITTSVPKQMKLINYRKNARFVVPRKESVNDHVIVENNGIYAQGNLALQDISDNGAGALITVPEISPLDAGTQVTVFINRKNGRMRFTGRIVKIEVADEYQSPAGYRTFRVGIERCSRKEGNKKSGTERRRTPRDKISRQITVQPIFNSERKLLLNIEEASVTGFRARLDQPQDRYLLPLGGIAFCEEFGLSLEHVRASEDSLSFEIVDGNDTARLKWVQSLDRGKVPNRSTSSSSGSEILSLFCKSGVLAVPYIHNQRGCAGSLAQQYSQDERYSSWIRRWIQHSGDGDASNHISAVRYGDSSWYLGDIVKSQDDKSENSAFIDEFLSSFADFTENQSPTPSIVIGWKVGHKYWIEYRQWLTQHDFNNRGGLLKSKYVRTGNKLQGTGCTIEEINDYDCDLTAALLSKGGVALARLAEALDFTRTSFGSPRLKTLIKDCSHHYRREYYVITDIATGHRGLAIVSDYPKAASPLSNENVPWILPLDDLNEISEIAIVSGLHNHAVRKGFTFPGILVAQTHNADSAAELEWYIGSMRALDFFRNVGTR